MNKKGSSSTGIAIVLVLIILAAGFFLASSRWKSDSPTAINIGTKEAVKCNLYSDGIYKNEYKAGEDKALPRGISVIARDLGADLCGSITSLGYVYYLSNADDQTIIDTYKDGIQKADCKTDDPIKGKENSSYSFNMHYACKGGDGYVATDAHRKAFYVGFNTSSSPTEAVDGGSSNANMNSNWDNLNSNLNNNSNSQ